MFISILLQQHFRNDLFCMVSLTLRPSVAMTRWPCCPGNVSSQNNAMTSMCHRWRQLVTEMATWIEGRSVRQSSKELSVFSPWIDWLVYKRLNLIVDNLVMSFCYPIVALYLNICYSKFWCGRLCHYAPDDVNRRMYIQIIRSLNFSDSQSETSISPICGRILI